MTERKKNKSDFLIEREKLFENKSLIKSSFDLCIQYSLLVEEYIIRLVHAKKINCVLAAVGSFSRRELSPYSNIDLMFIVSHLKEHETEIENCVNKLKDSGIEVTYTIREFSDIKKIMQEDLYSFTQLFETRFIYGNKEVYDNWNKQFFKEIENSDKEKLIFSLINDISERHKKYGNSPKILEPNIKLSAGGLRDIHTIEWMYSIKNNYVFFQQNEITQTERFLELLYSERQISLTTKKELLESYGFLLKTRNNLHLLNGKRVDRLEFDDQKKIAVKLGYQDSEWRNFMMQYFNSSTILNRFSKTMIKKYKQDFAPPLSDYLNIKLDDDFFIKGKIISYTGNRNFTIPEIMRAFYYRALNNAIFEKDLRSLIIEAVNIYTNYQQAEIQSSVFFREILKLSANVANTLFVMNEFGFLGIFLREFEELVGFIQPGVYHTYTADEHTLVAIKNAENLYKQDNPFAKIFKALRSKDILYMAILLHDIAKPISIEGHEIIGAEISNSIMERLGYADEDIGSVEFLVKNHLLMEQVAFRRDINDPVTLDMFVKIFPSVELLDLLYLLTFADLSAVSPVIWTKWKESLLNELYTKAKRMITEQLTGKELLSIKSMEALEDSENIEENSFIEHLEQMDDVSYTIHFSQEEINRHIEEIKKGSNIAVFIKKGEAFTNITVIAKEYKSLLPNICAALTVTNLEIHDAKVFTRKNGIVIYSFSVTDFSTHEGIKPYSAKKIKNLLTKIANKEIDIEKEFEKVQTKWKRLATSLPDKANKIEVNIKEHEKFTLIEIHSPDRIGLLYQITHKIIELKLKIYFAKIATRVNDIIDTFYVLKTNNKKIPEKEFDFYKTELTEIIKQIL